MSTPRFHRSAFFMLTKQRFLSVLIGVLTIASAEAFVGSPAAKAQTGPVPIPPIVSPSTTHKPTTVDRDFSQPKAPPSPQIITFPGPPAPQKTLTGFVPGVSTEIVSERRAAAKIFANPDGTRTARVYSGPIHYQDASGAWKDIDTKLVADAVGGYRNSGGPLSLHFAPASNDPSLATVSAGGHQISFSMEGASPSVGVPSGSGIRYAGVATDTDLEYHVGTDVLKEIVVLNHAPASGSGASFRFVLNPGDLAPRADDDGSIGLYDDAGTKVLAVPPATMWDSRQDLRSGEPAYGPAHLTLSWEGENWIVSVEGDGAWLADSSRTYPVYIDPTVAFGAGRSGGGDDAFVMSAYPNNNYNVSWNSSLGRYEDKIGYYDSTTGTNWTYLHYNLDFLNGRHIISALWSGYFIWSFYVSTNTPYWLHPVAAGWCNTCITWNNRAGVMGDNLQDSAARNQWHYDDITGWVYNWTHGVWGNNGIEIDTNGNGQTYWKKLAADENGDGSQSYIQVNYNTPPNAASALSPSNGSAPHTLTPTLSVTGSDPDGDPLNFNYWLCIDPGMTQCIWNSGWTAWPGPNPNSINVPAGLLAWNRTYYWQAWPGDGTDSGPPSPLWSFRTSNSAPPVPGLASPSNDAMVSTTTPSFTAGTVSDPDNPPDAVSYQFRITTGADGSGNIIYSGWGGPTWSPPPGSLTDGLSYYWSVQAKDSTNDPSGVSAWSSSQPFRVDLGLGDKASRPFDKLGPVTVNLANGNALVSTSSPSFKAVGGSLGLSYNYNSQAPSNAGLKGYYFNDDGNHVLDSYEAPSLTRTDSQVSFSWGSGSPYPSINSDNFNARWVGYVTVPTAGSYKFGTRADDGTRVWINNTLVLDHWVNQGQPANPDYGSSVTLAAGQTVPVKVEYFENGGGANVELWANGPFGSGGATIDAIVPASWLTTDLPGLPDGWSFSADPDGDLSYTFARIGDTSVVLLDSTGATHSFRRTDAGWAPQDDEQGVLANDSSTGLLVLHSQDGRVYNFNADGTLASVTSPVDDRSPAALVYLWTGTPARLTRVTDTVSNRAIVLTYGLDSGCPTGAGYTPAPNFMLCKVDYSAFNGGETDLYYSNGHLARIADPGGVTTDFGYDTNGRLTQIRDPLNNDFIACGPTQCPDFYSNPNILPDSDYHKTLIAYDPSSSKATSVTAPVPDSSGQNRPAHRFDYQSGYTLAHVDGISGANEPNGYARKATYNSVGQMTEDRDLAGRATSFDWDSFDHLKKKTDPIGLVTTHLYDAAGRETDAYGPGLANEFSGYTSTTTAHSVTNYDEGIDGLAAAWWANKNLSGPPLRHSTSSVQENWGTGSPDAAIPSDNFSGRLTGEINTSVTGTYGFSADVGDEDGVRVFVDDKSVVNRWPYVGTVLADGPVGYWRLGETSGTTASDSSGNGNNGTYLNGVSLGAAGAIPDIADKAASFDGVDDYVQVPNSAALNPTRVSVEAWVKSNTSTWNAYGYIVSHRDAYILHPNVGTKSLTFNIYDGSSWAYVTWTAPDSFDLTQWHHYAGTFDGATMRLFADGAEVASNPWSGNINTSSTNPLYIGRDDPSAGPRFGNASIDEAAVYPTALSTSRIASHYQAGTARLSGTTAGSLNPGVHRIRIDYQELTGAAQLKLNWTPPGGSSVPVPATNLKPRYNLVTSQIDPDGHKTATEFATPYLGLPTASVLDPQGLNLRSTYSYEPAGTGYFRQISRTLPKGSATAVSYSYFGASETADNPCTAPVETINQAGDLKTETDADPDGAGPQAPIVREYRYDEAGRMVAQRVVGDANWACAAYDPRGRVASYKDSSGKTTTFDYSNPAQVTTSYTDSGGINRNTVTKIDWLGRALSYADENGTITRTTYDQAGRPTATYRQFSGQPETQLTSFSYSSATARLASITEYASGTGRTTTFSYDDAGKLLSTTRPNGVVTTNTFDANRGWLNSISNTKNANELSPWTYTRNPSGKVASEATTGRTRNFTFDAAGRLTRTVEGATTRNYSFDADSNRCSTSTSCDGSYTFDSADKLLASPFATGYQYDSHGNLISANPIAQPPAGSLNQSFSFDAAASTAPHDYQVIVGQSGTLSTTLDWTPVTYRTGSASGSMAPAAVATSTVNVAGSSSLSSSLTWAQGSKPQTSTFSSTITAASTNSHLISPSATGTVTASLDWSPATTSFSDNAVYILNPTVPDGVHTHNYPIAVGADGIISASLNWSAVMPSSNLDLDLYDSAGNKVASSDSLLGNSESISYPVTGLSYPATAAYP
jgi:YD repeat-containing protein